MTFDLYSDTHNTLSSAACFFFPLPLQYHYIILSITCGRNFTCKIYERNQLDKFIKRNKCKRTCTFTRGKTMGNFQNMMQQANVMRGKYFFSIHIPL